MTDTSRVVRTIEAERPLAESLGQLLDYRELLFAWTIREIRARYRQSLLGFGWALIQPIFQMVVISIVFGSFLRVPSGDVPYPIFAFVAILPWTLFAGAINAAVPSILGNMQLVTKIYFPREILPISAALARLVDFTIALVVFAALMIWYDIPLYNTVVYVPLLLVIQMLLALGIGLLGSAVTVFVRDISFAIPLAMQIWMYLSPVIYPLSEVPPRWRVLYMLNPMTGVIDSYRRVVLQGQPPDPTYLAIAAAMALVVFLVAFVYFKRVEMAMSDII